MLLRTSQNLQGKEILIIPDVSGNFILKLRIPGIFPNFPAISEMSWRNPGKAVRDFLLWDFGGNIS